MKGSQWIQYGLKFLLVALVSVFAGLSYGQQYSFQKFGIEKGLPSRIITCTMIDQEGFLWVGSFGGLFKYDGQTFHHFESSIKDSLGLQVNHIRAIFQSSNGLIWVGTPDGLHVIDNDKVSVVDLPNPDNDIDVDYINDINQDASGTICIATAQGCYLIDQHTWQVSYLYETLGQEKTFGISVYNDDVYFCGANQIVKINSSNYQEIERFPINFLDDSDNIYIAVDKVLPFGKKDLLISSSIGLLNMSITKDSAAVFSRFYARDGLPIADENIYDVEIDEEGIIWTASYTGKFKNYTIENGILEELHQFVFEKSQLISNHVFDINFDLQKNIWISSASGLFKLQKTEKPFFVYDPTKHGECFFKDLVISGVEGDGNGHIWLSTSNGVYRIDRNDILNNLCPVQYLHYPKIEINNAKLLEVDRYNRIWISSNHGLRMSYLDQHSNPIKWHHFTTSDGLPHHWCGEILVDNDSVAWITNYWGLVKANIQKGSQPIVTFQSFAHDPTRANSLVNTYTQELARDAYDDLWIGTFSGISRLESEEFEGSFGNYLSKNNDFTSLSNNSIKATLKDGQGNLWFGTQQGLNLYRYDDDSFLRFGKEDGLPSNYTLDLRQDGNQRIWLSTTNGIFSFIYNDTTNTLDDQQLYGVGDGLADQITYRGALYIDEDDNIFAGGAKGLSVFTSETKELDSTNFNIVLSQFLASTKENGFEDVSNSIVDDAIDLQHYQNSILLHFVSLDFSHVENNRYRYKLLPSIPGWVELGNQSDINLLNLSEGDYTIVLEASNSNEKWVNKTLTLDIIIHPPIWKSTVAYLLYAILGAVLIRSIYKNRLKTKTRVLREQIKIEQALQLQREKLRKENAADFHDELGNKITRISLFLTLIERNLPGNKDLSEWVQKIRSNVNELSGGFRDLLWVIDPQKDSIADTILRLKDFGEDLFKNSGCEFKVEGLTNELSDLTFSPGTKKHVILLFKEAMNNTIKYAECGNAVLKLNRINGSIDMSFSDDGKGFDINANPDGRGLKNIKMRAQKIGVDLNIEAKVDQGVDIQLLQIPHLGEAIK